LGGFELSRESHIKWDVIFKEQRQIKKMLKKINLDFLLKILRSNMKIINIRGETIRGSIL